MISHCGQEFIAARHCPEQFAQTQVPRECFCVPGQLALHIKIAVAIHQMRFHDFMRSFSCSYVTEYLCAIA